MPQTGLWEAVLNEAPAAHPVVDGAGVVSLANAAARHLLSVDEAGNRPAVPRPAGLLPAAGVASVLYQDDRDTPYFGRIMGRALNEIYFLAPDTWRSTLPNQGVEVKPECNSQQLAQMALPDVMPDPGIVELKTLF